MRSRTQPETIAQRLAQPQTLLRSLPRTVELDHAEARASRDGSVVRFEGHAAVFNSPSETLHDMWGPFRETLLPGCFADAIDANTEGREDTKFLGLNHDASSILARFGNGTLELEEDETGLLVRANLAPTARAHELAILLERRDVHQMSFQFTVTKDGETWGWDEIGDLRKISAVARLYDVCPVTWPAYTETDAGLRELAALRSLAIDIDAGRRSADPASLATIGRALHALEDLPADVAARARAAAEPSKRGEASAPIAPPLTITEPTTPPASVVLLREQLQRNARQHGVLLDA